MQVWDFKPFLNSLADSGPVAHKEEDIIHNHVPLKVFSGHKDEGYAIDWSPHVTGRLVSGMKYTYSILECLPSSTVA
jgi:ribosome assembly protein RRB1